MPDMVVINISNVDTLRSNNMLDAGISASNM